MDQQAEINNEVPIDVGANSVYSLAHTLLSTQRTTLRVRLIESTVPVVELRIVTNGAELAKPYILRLFTTSLNDSTDDGDVDIKCPGKNVFTG